MKEIESEILELRASIRRQRILLYGMAVANAAFMGLAATTRSDDANFERIKCKSLKCEVITVSKESTSDEIDPSIVLSAIENSTHFRMEGGGSSGLIECMAGQDFAMMSVRGPDNGGCSMFSSDRRNSILVNDVDLKVPVSLSRTQPPRRVLESVRTPNPSGFDRSPLREALLGHWATESGKVHYYFDSDTVVMIEGNRRIEFGYQVLDLHEEHRWLDIRVKSAKNGEHVKTLRFDTKKRSLAVTVDIAPGEMKWIFVNSDRRPTS